MPYSDDDAKWLVTYFDRFNQVYVDAAEKYGVHYIDIGAATVEGGHGPCAAPDDKWFEGLIPTSWAQPGHFNERGMQAVADMDSQGLYDKSTASEVAHDLEKPAREGMDAVRDAAKDAARSVGEHGKDAAAGVRDQATGPA